MSNTFHRTDYPTSNNELSKSLWSTRTWSVDNYNQFVCSRPTNLPRITNYKDVKLSDALLRDYYTNGHSNVFGSLWSAFRQWMGNNNKQLQSRSSNMQSIGSNADSVMPTWIYWKHHTKQILQLFGSVFHANLVGLGNDFQYMYNDSYEYKQPSESYKSDQSNESEFGYIQEYNPNGCATCGCSTKPCYCEYPIKLNNNEYNEHKLK